MTTPLNSILAGLALSGLLLCLSPAARAQAPVQPELGPYDTIPVPAMVHENALIPGGMLEWVYVHAPYPRHLLKKRQEYDRLRNAVYVTYPYARKAAYVLNDINRNLEGISSVKERKSYIRSREKDLRRQFGEPIQNLSVYQGKVLMKLINRQTGNNCYEILKEYKGGLNARMLQTVAFLFGTNLKQPYDPAGEDLVIERIVMEIESLYGRR